MNTFLSKFLLYYPSTFLKGEPVGFLMSEYNKNQYLDSGSFEKYQFSKVKKLVSFAYAKNKFYHELFDQNGFSPDQFNRLSDIKSIPTITKLALINDRERLLTPGLGLFRSYKTTGGSTGQPVSLVKNPMALARERCATWRGYEWAGVNVGDSQLRLWGIPHGDTDAIKSKLIDLIANRKRISAFDLTEDSMLKYYFLAKKFRPKFIYGYVSAIDEFASFMKRNGLEPLISVKSVITTSEVLSPHSKTNIESAFGVEVFNEYGCGEVGSIAHQCEKGNMHVMADNLIVEQDSESGELIVTDLFNYSMPLIRYRLGDFGRLSDEACTCGRIFPVIQKIHGRAYDILIMPDGRRVHPESVIYVFEKIQENRNSFAQFQVIQQTPHEFKVFIVPGPKFSSDILNLVAQNLRNKLHKDIRISFEVVNKIARERSGKMRVVKRDFKI